MMSFTLKDFLEDCHKLKTLLLILSNGTAVLEAKVPIKKILYAEVPQGIYANIHQDNWEIHLKINAIKQIKFETAKARNGDFPTYIIRFLKDNNESALTAFLQWGEPGAYEPGQVEAWQELKEKYGEVWQPLPVESI
ncbi:MAG: ChuX/HutX family heme-like substrate-binding protein [Microcoleaceae cyanobacterium]